jgi:hypothetical protein
MRSLVRAALSATAVAVVATMAPAVPAQAAGGGWVYAQAPSVLIDENFFMHKHVDGRPGNWHLLNIRVQQDDDGTMGGLTDLRCPKGESPAPNGDDNCVNVGGAYFDDDSGITVTWAPRLRNIHVRGAIVLHDNATDAPTPSTINLRLYAAGRLHRTVTRSVEGDTQPMEFKRVELRRGGKITAEGHLGWLKSTRAQVRNTQPLYVYWVKTRPAV